MHAEICSKSHLCGGGEKKDGSRSISDITCVTTINTGANTHLGYCDLIRDETVIFADCDERLFSLLALTQSEGWCAM